MTESQPHDPQAHDPQPYDQPPHGSQSHEPQSHDSQPEDPLAGARQAVDPNAADPRTSGLRCRVRVGSADGILAVVPHLLGFHPADSLVMLGIGGPHARIRLAFRYDLPDPPEDGLAAEIAAPAATVL